MTDAVEAAVEFLRAHPFECALEGELERAKLGEFDYSALRGSDAEAGKAAVNARG